MVQATKELKAGDSCPCGGDFVIDKEQSPETLIDRKTRNAVNPSAAARFADRVREKVEEHGLIHKCLECGYRTRFKVSGKAK